MVKLLNHFFMSKKKKKKNKEKKVVSLKTKVDKGVEILRSKISTYKDNIKKNKSFIEKKIKPLLKKNKIQKKEETNIEEKKVLGRGIKSKKTLWVDWKLAFFLAWKSIQRGNKSSLVLVIGIMMVVFLNLLFTDSIFAGIGKGINDRKINYQYGEILIEPEIGEEFISGANEIIKKYKDDYRVKSIGKEIKKQATFVNEKERDGRDFESLGASLHNLGIKSVFNIENKIVDGRMLKESDFGKIMIGTSMAGGYKGSMTSEDLGSVRVGDKISVRIGNLSREFEIVGIYKTKNSSLDKDAIIIDSDIYSLVGGRGLASNIVIKLYDRNDAFKMRDEFRAKNPNLEISDWKENISAGAGITKSFDMIGEILRIIGSLVAGLVIFIIIFVDIVNKRRQVGILKAIGINQKIIINSYIIRGVFYTILGSIFGYLLMQYAIIGAFTKKPIDLPMGDIVPLIKDASLKSSIIFFILAGFIGSAFPAWKEIKKKILDLLYH